MNTPALVVKNGEIRIIGIALLADGRYELVPQGHESYVEPLDGGNRGYQARCWDCDWQGHEFMRGDETLGTERSRIHKRNAKVEAAEHHESTKGVTA